MNAEQKAEALRMAVNFREWAQDAMEHDRHFVPVHPGTLMDAYYLLRTLASEPQGEPVAWAIPDQIQRMRQFKYFPDDLPLYLHPAPAQTPLTDEEIGHIVKNMNEDLTGFRGWGWLDLARAVLKAQEEKT